MVEGTQVISRGNIRIACVVGQFRAVTLQLGNLREYGTYRGCLLFFLERGAEGEGYNRI